VLPLHRLVGTSVGKIARELRDSSVVLDSLVAARLLALPSKDASRHNSGTYEADQTKNCLEKDLWVEDAT
jgi:hypothetical protein